MCINNQNTYIFIKEDILIITLFKKKSDVIMEIHNFMENKNGNVRKRFLFPTELPSAQQFFQLFVYIHLLHTVTFDTIYLTYLTT